MNQSGGIDMEQRRADDVGRDLLDTAAQPVGDLGDRHLVGERAHDELLQRAQLPGFGDVLEQREDVFDAALLVAEGVDPGADPDLLAVLVVSERLDLAAPSAMHQALDELRDGLAIGVAAGEQLGRAAALGFAAGVAEQRREGGIDVTDILLDVGDDHHAIGLVGDRVEQPDPDATLGIGGDVAREHDVMGCALDRRRRQRDRRLDPVAIAPHQADLVAKIRDRIGLKASQREDFGIVAEHVSARKLPYPLGAGVEVRDAMRVIDNDDAVVGAFERRPQHVRHFGHWEVGGRHR